eukprot:622349-Pelagomonas_calceolata.AAC.1
MQQQYDVILGYTWLQKTNALLDCKTNSCIVGNSQKQVLLPVRQTSQTTTSKQSMVAYSPRLWLMAA